MPELPEVETVRSGLEKTIKGKLISSYFTSGKKMRQMPKKSELELLKNAKIKNIKRRSKYLLIELSNCNILIIHLGMSGKVIFKDRKYKPQKHDHLILSFSDESKMVFNDPRRFGLYLIVDEKNIKAHKLFKDLGPEPLTSEFDANYLKDILKSKSVNIKQAIMDAANVVGVGNIYAAESLFRSGINPQTASNKINLNKLISLTQNIKQVLLEAIESGGSTLRDYVRSDGGLGYFQNKHYVYGRENLPCFICTTKIKRIRQQGRSTFYCPKCQK